MDIWKEFCTCMFYIMIVRSMWDFVHLCCSSLVGIRRTQLPALSCMLCTCMEHRHFHQCILCFNTSLLHVHLLAGFQFLDAFLCCSCLCREHSQIWVATIIFGTKSNFPVLIGNLQGKLWRISAGILQAVVLAPLVKSEKKVRGILEELCGNINR